MICLAEQYIRLCRLIAEEQRLIQKKSTILGIRKLLNLPSTSIIEVNGNTAYRNDPLGSRIIYYDDLEREIAASLKIIDLMKQTAKLIDPSFSVHVMMTYMTLDRDGNRRFARQEAECFDYDRRTFRKNMNAAIEEALKKPEMVLLLEQIRKIAETNGRREYLDVFDEKAGKRKRNLKEKE